MRILATLLALACSLSALAQDRPKHVVLVIGDGMGLTQMTAARVFQGRPLFLETAQAVGLQSTWSTTLVTDSAAGATAMACGVKTDNGMIGQTPDGQPCTTLMEEAIAQGRSTGIVVTSRVTHATPASFVAHVASRKDEPSIAEQMVKVPLDVLIGGGRDMFADRQDGQDLLSVWRKAKVTVYDGPADFLARHRRGRAVVFTAQASPKPVNTRDATAPLARRAFDLLDDDPEGALLLVEGSQIDWGGHGNRLDYVIAEMLDLDATVKALVEAAGPDTLVVVTADHETGGLAILDGRISGGMPRGQFTTDHHSAVHVPVYAWGPGAAAFTGVYDNTVLHTKLRAALGLAD